MTVYETHCPTCKAKPSEPCWNLRTGEPTGNPHSERVPKCEHGRKRAHWFAHSWPRHRWERTNKEPSVMWPGYRWCEGGE